MPFGLIFDQHTAFILMLGNLMLGARSYQLIRHSKTRAMLDMNWRISVITHLVGSIIFILLGSYVGR